MFLKKGGMEITFGKCQCKGRERCGNWQGERGTGAHTGVVVRIVFAGKVVVVVVGTVLCKRFTVMHRKEFDHARLWIFCKMFLVMASKVGQFGKYIFYLSGHNGREQVEEKQYVCEDAMHGSKVTNTDCFFEFVYISFRIG